MHSKVSELLNKINGLTKRPEFPQLSELEYDLVMQYLRDLYQELSLLRDTKLQRSQEIEAIGLFKAEQRIGSTKIEKEEDSARITPKDSTVIISETPVKSDIHSSLNEVIRPGETLNSKLKATPAKEIHHKLSSKPMKDLIDLNKRYVVVNELFKGDAEACAKAIQHIDASESYASAEVYTHSTLIPAYQWNESSETVKLFLSLVKQRFGVE
jgi:hypothetical protein